MVQRRVSSRLTGKARTVRSGALRSDATPEAPSEAEVAGVTAATRSQSRTLRSRVNTDGLNVADVEAVTASAAFVVRVPPITGNTKAASAFSIASTDSEVQSAGTPGAVSYQTPLTSAGATPANLGEDQNSRWPKGVNAHRRAAELRTSKYSILGKRTRDQDNDGDEEYDDEEKLEADESDGLALTSSRRVYEKTLTQSLEHNLDEMRVQKIAKINPRQKKGRLEALSLTGKKRRAVKQIGPDRGWGSEGSDSSSSDEGGLLALRQKSSWSLRHAKKQTTEETPKSEDDDNVLNKESSHLSNKGSDVDTDYSNDSVIGGVRVKSARHRFNIRQDNPRLRRHTRLSFRRHHHRSKLDRVRHKMLANHPFLSKMWTSLEAKGTIQKEKVEQPANIKQMLKPFQLEGLNWLVKQEQTEYKGGLLADEMGMGKTIQAVSLIMSDYPQPKPTLVVMPPVALMQWQNEIASYTDGKLKVLVYHGTNTKSKNLTEAALKEFNVILISYSSLESLYRKQSKGFNRKDENGQPINVTEDSIIHHIAYHRVILDEAHNIKNRFSSSAKACFELDADFRWCLSGTPLQNRIGELLSLLRFLRITPYACYACKNCACSKLDWEAIGESRKCSCGHTGLLHVSLFNQEILDPITKEGGTEKAVTAFKNLKLLTNAIMLRREKRHNTAAMELPVKKVEIHSCFFGEIEQDFAASIMSATNRKFDNYVSHGVMLNNYANIFGLIMQMRQIADHPDLVLKKNNVEGRTDVLVCEICNEAAEDTIRSSCKHHFCRSCVTEYFESVTNQGGTPECARCHLNLRIDLEQPELVQEASGVKKSSIINKIDMLRWTSSTKIEMLMYDLTKLRMKGLRTKSIIFSQFTSMLQLIEWRLKNAGFLTVALDGSMTPAQRQKSIDYFQKTPKVECFLVSLKAGGVALNLTEASQVFIVDPWWNPAAEWQSADRCHRIGQNRPVKVTRLVIEDSVESRIVQLQSKKAAMISGTIDGDNAAMANLSPEDMQFLFNG
ncbi:MAG: DNA repair protein rad16 [Vezdaea aestivalis]|nr:MAG: DNA repair protein rad16 [Vezdaea aestivalis]